MYGGAGSGGGDGVWADGLQEPLFKKLKSLFVIYADFERLTTKPAWHSVHQKDEHRQISTSQTLWFYERCEQHRR